MLLVLPAFLCSNPHSSNIPPNFLRAEESELCPWMVGHVSKQLESYLYVYHFILKPILHTLLLKYLCVIQKPPPKPSTKIGNPRGFIRLNRATSWLLHVCIFEIIEKDSHDALSSCCAFWEPVSYVPKSWLELIGYIR